MLQALPIDMIDRRPDARALNDASVASLADSIACVGLINPIRVRAVGDRWEVSAGSHRLAACEKLGLVEIECLVVSDDDLHAELSMIDENLCRNELSPAERASQTARRKEIYEALNPQTAHGGNAGGPSGQFVHTDAGSFAEETAKATGKDERSVRRDAERGSKVIAEVIDMITGTKLDTGTYLDKLKRLPPNDQFSAAKRDLALLKEQERERASGIARRIVKKADAPMPEEETREKWLAAGMSWWNRAPQEWREEFLSRVDKPVFEKTTFSTGGQTKALRPHCRNPGEHCGGYGSKHCHQCELLHAQGEAA